MRHLSENPKDGITKGIQARNDMVQTYSEPVIGHNLYNHFHRIAEVLQQSKRMKDSNAYSITSVEL